MVTSEILNPVIEFGDVDDSIAKQIDDAVEQAEHRANAETDAKAKLFYTMPFPGVRYYSFKETASA